MSVHSCSYCLYWFSVVILSEVLLAWLSLEFKFIWCLKGLKVKLIWLELCADSLIKNRLSVWLTDRPVRPPSPLSQVKYLLICCNCYGARWNLLFLHMHYCHSVLIKLPLRGTRPLMWQIIPAKSNTWESSECSFRNSTVALIWI